MAWHLWHIFRIIYFIRLLWNYAGQKKKNCSKDQVRALLQKKLNKLLGVSLISWLTPCLFVLWMCVYFCSDHALFRLLDLSEMWQRFAHFRKTGFGCMHVVLLILDSYNRNHASLFNDGSISGCFCFIRFCFHCWFLFLWWLFSDFSVLFHPNFTRNVLRAFCVFLSCHNFVFWH